MLIVIGKITPNDTIPKFTFIDSSMEYFEQRTIDMTDIDTAANVSRLRM